MTRKLFYALLTALLALSGFAANASADPAAAQAARADIQKTLGFVPVMFQKLPDAMLPGTWDELKGLQLNPGTALDGRAKELIGLAVSAQVPCRYCIVAHTELAKLNGASEVELGEAVAMAAITRHWSTFLNGTQTDETRFRNELGKLIANAKQPATAKRTTTLTIQVSDGASAIADMTALFGFAPDFIARFPEAGRAGAWKQMRDLEISTKTALSGKTKELIGLAVSSQIPCRYCVIAHTELARLNGATAQELNEAVAMASLTRSMSTLLNGLQVDEPQFRRDVDRLVKTAKASAKQAAVSKR
jgi:AhpD family alkylhydroperoxidase